MAKAHSDLGAAHRGYIYQDVATAYFMLRNLAAQSGTLIVDSKLCDDDRFDDLTVLRPTSVTRRQFKHSDSAGRALKRSDLTSDDYSLKIDTLIRTYKRTSAAPTDEYRMCVTWSPSTDPSLIPYLEADTARSSSFPGHRTLLFRLKPGDIWPANGDPVWRALKNASDVTRQDFCNFAGQFVIELGCPTASLDFQNPGELEHLILGLLKDRIGIGRYPNQSLDPVTVADSLAWSASVARSCKETLGISDIERRIGLRKDYGREAQRFPVETAALVLREPFKGSLSAVVAESQKTVLIGQPGSGKSWALDTLGDALKQGDHLVARHYCYLSPGDERVERRVTTNVLFANLIAELVDARPDLKDAARRLYSAGPEELVDILPKAVAASPTGQVFLIVDGLDHIARVRSISRSLSGVETDIVEELSVLPLPNGVHLVLGSQPGSHLDPLRASGASAVEVPAWTRSDVESLADRLGVPDAIRSAELGDRGEITLETLAERADGNPLYATYLCKELLHALETGAALSPVTFMEGMPGLQGDIANYYRHLLQTSDRVGGMVANLLGTIDFGVSQEELGQILSNAPYLIDGALDGLSPVLVQVAGQGGVRIYHESFRRFMLEELEHRGIPIAQIMAPLIDWLTGRDFFADAKAYRFLLPCLRRAGRLDEISSLVSFSFVSASVESGHSRRTISANLQIAVEVAAERIDLPALARYSHLRWAMQTCFDRIDLEEYGRTFAELFGPQALSDRLLFEGGPTWPRAGGLLMCSLCDDMGGVPPWREYLALNTSGEADSESDIREAEFHGSVRTRGAEVLLPSVARYLNAYPDTDEEYVRTIARRLGETGGIDVIMALTKRVRKHPRILLLLTLEAAAFAKMSDPKAALALAMDALKLCTDCIHAADAVKMGAGPTVIDDRFADPSLFAVASHRRGTYSDEPHVTRQWVAAVTLAAIVRSERLASARSQVEGEGWYRDWLRYVISLAEAEVQARTDARKAEADIVAAFEELASDTDPFKGSPRACDLYRFLDIIHDTIERGLRLVSSEDGWRAVFAALLAVSRGTTTYLQRSRSGPLVPEALAEIILPYTGGTVMREEFTDLLLMQCADAERSDELFVVYVSHKMIVSRALVWAGRADAARQHWADAARYLCSYGMRKETSVFELLDTLPSLAALDPIRTRFLLERSQPLSDTVLYHTDGAATKHAPNAWFRSLAAVDPVGAAYLLGRTMVLDGGDLHWIPERAFTEVALGAAKGADPVIAAYLAASVPYGTEDEDLARRLIAIERLLATHRDLGIRLIGILAAQIQGDVVEPAPSAYADVVSLAGRFGISLPEWNYPWEAKTTTAEATPSSEGEGADPFGNAPLFPQDATPLQVLSWVRTNAHYSGSKADYGRFTEGLLSRLLGFCEEGREAEAGRVLRYVARELWFPSGVSPLAVVAEGLAKEGRKDLAAMAWALAYARSRGGGGWQVLGGLEHASWIANGTACSPDIAWRTLTAEVAHFLHSGDVYGAAKSIIQLLATCGRAEDAFAAWEAVFEVVADRLAGGASERPGMFLPYRAGDIPDWTVDEALSWLLVARASHPELKRKMAALSGCAELCRTSPVTMLAGFQQMLKVDTTASTVLCLLQVLYQYEQEPYTITLALESELRTLIQCNHFGIKWTAANLVLKATNVVGFGFDTSPLAVGDVSEIMEVPNDSPIGWLDWGDRVSNVVRFWPEFPQMLHLHFSRLWFGVKANMRRERSRHEAAGGRIHHDRPATPLLTWAQEMFGCAFHEIACGITGQLIKQGRWHPMAEFALLPHLVPNASAHIAAWYSRTLRPSLELPSRQDDSNSDIIPVTQERTYPDWVRLGSFEEELLLAPGVLQGTNGMATVVSSVAFGGAPRTSDEPGLPVGVGHIETWFDAISARKNQRAKFKGPLVGLEILRDTLGSKALLALHPRVIAACRLVPSPARYGYELEDERGNLAAVLRTWSIRPFGKEISGESIRIRGCELLVRPDTFERMRQMSHLSPSEIKVVIRNMDVENDAELE